MHASPETKQLALWRSEFGRDYTDRNDVERPARIEVWRRILDGVPVGSILEVGCNAGWNLEYLHRLGYTDAQGIEPQTYAVEQLRARRPHLRAQVGTAFDLPFADASFDLVFTSGVLIHIDGADLPRALAEMHRVSRRFVLAIEYDHPTEQEIHYRGHDGALWKRDHGAAWQRAFPALRELRRGHLGAADGYDDCTFHLFEKPQP
jgi:pseudaminic acid biosynthesis-associated methylase